MVVGFISRWQVWLLQPLKSIPMYLEILLFALIICTW